jgi:hypothetical protein
MSFEWEGEAVDGQKPELVRRLRGEKMGAIKEAKGLPPRRVADADVVRAVRHEIASGFLKFGDKPPRESQD